MGLLTRSRKQTADIESGAQSNSAAAGARGAYEIDEHLLPREEVAAKYGTKIDWKNIQGSQGLSTKQVRAKRLTWSWRAGSSSWSRR